jgi:hypothetical protein
LLPLTDAIHAWQIEILNLGTAILKSRAATAAEAAAMRFY